jgi:hypothetical protein
MATLNVNPEHITMPRTENILQMKAKKNKVLQTIYFLVYDIDLFYIYC